MTQDVQPLTWQKRTNIEEHMQFFSKINEIIANLAPTVDEAEAAIAQATAAIASANDAVATANAASAAASAAASQAQTAASTVAGYDNRLTAAEDDIDTQGQQITVLQGRAGALETGMTALGTRMTAAESKNSQQDTDIAALQTADAQNVKISRINEYAVGLTGNQSNILGIKEFKGGVRYVSDAYPMYHCQCMAIQDGEVLRANASGIQLYSGDAQQQYLGRLAYFWNETNKKANLDIRLNSIINSGQHARILVEEKDDGTFALSFWNGQAWSRLVQ